MNEEELKRLIEKYYNGESTEEEESALRDYFRKGNIPEGYEAEKLIFSYYTESAELPEPSLDFEARILAGIDASDLKSRSPKMKKVSSSCIERSSRLAHSGRILLLLC
jgi:hypothetical protein